MPISETKFKITHRVKVTFQVDRAVHKNKKVNGTYTKR